MIFLLIAILISLTPDTGDRLHLCLDNVSDDDKLIMLLAFVVLIVETVIQGVIWWAILT
jgi:hypothetical protein